MWEEPDSEHGKTKKFKTETVKVTVNESRYVLYSWAITFHSEETKNLH